MAVIPEVLPSFAMCHECQMDFRPLASISNALVTSSFWYKVVVPGATSSDALDTSHGKVPGNVSA